MAIVFPLPNSSLVSNEEKENEKNLMIHSNARYMQGNTVSSITGIGNVTNLTNNPNDSVYGQVAASANNVFVVWEESAPYANSYDGNYDIFMKRSTDNGNTFQNNTKINISNNSGFSEHPQISASSNNVYAVWADNTIGNREIFFARSTDNGTTFDKGEKIKNLSNSSEDSYNQEVAAFGDSVYVVWQEKGTGDKNAVKLRASNDSGDTFGKSITVANGSEVNEDSFPKIAANENEIYLVWNLNSPEEIDSIYNSEHHKSGLFFTKSSDKGETFSHPVMLANGLSADIGEAQIAAYGDNVVVVWGGSKNVEVKNLHYIFSNNKGKSFANTTEIENEQFVRPLNVEIAIQTKDNNNNKINAGNNNNNSDPNPQQQRQEANTGTYHAFVVGEVKVSDNNEILLASGISNNTNTTTTTNSNIIGITETTNLSNNVGTSECPSISISENNIFVVWEDLTTGSHEIYFVKGTIRE